MKIKRKNGSNRYEVYLGGPPQVLLLFNLLPIFSFFLGLQYEEIFLMVMSILSFIILICISIYMIIYCRKHPDLLKPLLLVDFDKEIAETKDRKIYLDVIQKIEYTRKYEDVHTYIVIHLKYEQIKIPYYCYYRNDKYDITKISNDYGIKYKINIINNKLQEYRKQNNLD